MRGLGGTPPIEPEHGSANRRTKAARPPECSKRSLAACFERDISKHLGSNETGTRVLSQCGPHPERPQTASGYTSPNADPLNAGSVLFGVTALHAIQARMSPLMRESQSKPGGRCLMRHHIIEAQPHISSSRTHSARLMRCADPRSGEHPL